MAKRCFTHDARRTTHDGFHIASPEEIKAGQVTDVYFVRTLKILKARGLEGRRALAELTAGGLPEGWPWAVFCGLEEVIELLAGIQVDVNALPEGTLFPAHDRRGVRVPVMTVEGPYGRFCLYETPVLGLLCQATGVATKSARIRQAAGKAAVLGFGTRRMHPALAPMLDRASYLGGCDGVSNLAGGRMIGEEPRGTMPHALVIILGGSEPAWKAFDEAMPASVPRIALIDTYADEKQEAVNAARLLGKRLAGVRLDTPSSRRGDFPELVREVRWELDLRGYSKVRIVVSGGIGEEEIPALRAAGADGFGVGTAISNAPTVDLAMDLVELEGRPCAKRGRMGGRKMPWRCPRCLGYRVLPAGKKEDAPRCSGCRKKMLPMLRPVLRSGRRVGKAPKVGEIRSYVLSQIRSLHA